MKAKRTNQPSASSKHSPEEEKHLEKHKLRLVSDLSYLNRCINRVPPTRYFAFLDAVSGYHQVITWTRHPPTSPPSFSLVAASGISIIQKLKIIESQIPELSKAFQSQPKPFRVTQSLQESSKAFQSQPKPSRVIQSLQESAKAFQSQPKPSRVIQSLSESAKVIQILFFILFYFYIYIYLYFKPIIIYYIISLSAW